MESNIVHPHGGVVHGGVIHTMPSAMHGAGPDGEHPAQPRRRYQNRPKPINKLERLPLDEAAKRVCLFIHCNAYSLLEIN